MSPAELYAQFPRLRTQNLLLRDLVPGDAEALLRIFSDSQVTRYYDLDTFRTIAEARELIERFTKRFLNQVGIRWGIARKETPDTLIGTCGYNIWLPSSHRAIIGYDLARDHWKQGIMSEALKRVLDFGFGTMELNRIEALVFAKNLPSHRLLKKLGFQREGVLREYEFVKEKFVDLTMYSLLRREQIKKSE